MYKLSNISGALHCIRYAILTHLNYNSASCYE